jgi:hypothetical protein
MIKIKTTGDFKNTERFFEKSKKLSPRFRQIMERYGQQGVDALQKATPKDSGNTADSWSYSIEDWGLSFSNSNINNGVPVAILIQYGHATRNGGYVPGQDYINPALQPIFDQIVKDLDKEVQNL